MDKRRFIRMETAATLSTMPWDLSTRDFFGPDLGFLEVRGRMETYFDIWQRPARVAKPEKKAARKRQRAARRKNRGK